MKYYYSFLLLIFYCLVACNPKVKQEESDQMNSITNEVAAPVTTDITVPLIPFAREEVAAWKEYNDLESFLQNYKSTTTYEALANAGELSELVTYLKDSMRIEKLDQRNVMARINVLHNETLRLADMANIPSITNNEVIQEVETIVGLFNALNSKINTIYSGELFHNTLEVDTEKPIDPEDLEMENSKVKRPVFNRNRPQLKKPLKKRAE